MAIRVRKLARQLGRAPEDLLDLLKTLGLSQYNNANQMLPANAEDALRAAVRAVPPSRAVRRPDPVRRPVAQSQKIPASVPVETVSTAKASAVLTVEREALAKLRIELEAATAQVHANHRTRSGGSRALTTPSSAGRC
jgi:hypothetical protein